MNSEAANRNMLRENEPIDDAFEAIAIIGMVGRFPGARNVEQFWTNIRDGVESISHFSQQELLELGHDPELLNRPNYVRAKGIVEGVDQFDAFFFGFSPREAEVMDPQHRIFLESAWEALELAGYDAPRYAGRIGVFAGVGANSYLLRHVLSHGDPGAVSDVFQMSIANDKDFVPTRVSYQLNLTGPSINVNTGCSSSLVAVSLAVQSLLNYQCDMVLAGGVSLSFPQKTGYLYQEGMVSSPDGRCRAFDAQAQGAVGGEGVGIVVLKRLEEALADGDTIHAVIRGCSINNDGANKMGYTAPSVEGQASVIAEALAMSEVAPATISYVEAHGSGTPLGDPIEMAALKLAFQTGARSTETAEGQHATAQFCAIGSVKTNIGHTDTAAGVAGLIKTVQALKHRQLPPSLHFTEPNPQIDFANSPFYVNHTLQPWPQGKTPRRAGVSSFGIGGTNAHVVLEEAPPRAESAASRAYQLLPFSTKTSTALSQAVANLANHLQQQTDLNLADVAFTLSNRHPFSYRYTVLAQTMADAIAQLSRADDASMINPNMAQEESRLAFMFSGQGSQYVNMGRDLYASEPVFQETMDHCATLLTPHLGFDLCQVLYPTGDKAKATAALQLQQSAIAQPALFATEYALAQLWMAWGVEPVALLGHGIGEYVAACLAGVFTLGDALALVATRGQLMQSVSSGAMIDVPLSADAVQPYLNNQLAIAAINESDRCVIAGTHDAVTALEHHLTDEGLTCRSLHAPYASHSPVMEPILDDFAQLVAQVPLQSPTIPYISNCTGTWIRVADVTDPDYWVRHLRQTVRFAEGLTTLSMTADLLLEIGPGSTLTSFAQRHADLTQATLVTSLRDPQTEQSDVAHLLRALGDIWHQGVSIDWDAYYTHETRYRLPLPTYPFEHQSYWVEADSPAASTRMPSAVVANQRQPIDDWFYVPSWKHVPLPRQALPEHATWLLFVDEIGLGQQLADRLRQAQQSVVTVSTVREGAEFTQVAEDAFVINPMAREDYSTLWRTLEARSSGRPQKIIHLWNISHTLDKATPSAALTDSFFSLLYLVQAIGEHNVTDLLDIFIIANQLHNVTGTDEIRPAKAPLLGPTRVLPQEYENINCRAIDVMWPELHKPDADRAELIVSQLLNEFATGTEEMRSEEPLVAYRGQRRWLFYVEPIRLPESPIPIKTGGVYLITEGFGGIGLTLAEALAPWQTKLVLLSRSALPTRDAWEAWLTSHPANDSTSHQIRCLQRIEAMGAELCILSVDVTDGDAMQQTITQVLERFGTLHGVIHFADMPPNAVPMSQITPETAARILTAKVDGALVLSHTLANMPLDFMVRCSSLDAILGGFGRVTYTAVNAFEDAFAQSQKAPYPGISINWDVLSSIGMTTSQAISETGSETDSIFDFIGIKAEEGTKSFFKLLGSSLPQMVLCIHDLDQMVKSTRTREALQMLASLRTEAPKQSRPDIGVVYQSPQTPVEQWLADIWQTHLGIDQIGRDDDFFQHLAGQSLSAMGLINRLQDGLGAMIHLRAIFEAPTIGQMASYLQTYYADGLAQLGLVSAEVDDEAQPTMSESEPKPDTTAASLDPATLLNRLDQLSEAELDKALAALLEEQS